MINFNKVELNDYTRSKIVLLYIGCKLHGINYERINTLVNEIILAGATGKKLTFQTDCVMYEAQELIDFVHNYIYEQMENLLYINDGLNIQLMEESKDPLCEKNMFLYLIHQILNPELFDELGEGVIYISLSQAFSLSIGKNASTVYIPKDSPACRYNTLIEKAVYDYWNITKS